MLWALQRVYLGPPNEKYLDLPDISLREVATLAPLAVIVIVLGVYPQPILELIDVSLTHLNGVLVAAKQGGAAIASTATVAHP
jgi:NADH-quinone oxidoreductase subunit M